MPRLVSVLKRARALSVRDWRLLVDAVGLAITLEIALRVLPFNRLFAWFDRGGRERGPRASELIFAECQRAVDRVYRWMPLPRTCLKRSLVLYRLLRRRGVAVHFRLGVRREGESIGAHAWVEQDSEHDRAVAALEYLPFPQHPTKVPKP
jgi:hypothetical protein